MLRGIRWLAREERVVDLSALESVLGLPGLAAGAKWEVPPQPDHGRRYTSWDAPEASPLSNVVITPGVEWSAPGVAGGRYVHDGLTIVFREGACPSVAAFEKALGVEVEVQMLVPVHGSVLYPSYSFEVPTRSGSFVHIDLSTCGAYLASPSRITLPAAPPAFP